MEEYTEVFCRAGYSKEEDVENLKELNRRELNRMGVVKMGKSCTVIMTVTYSFEQLTALIEVATMACYISFTCSSCKQIDASSKQSFPSNKRYVCSLHNHF